MTVKFIKTKEDWYPAYHKDDPDNPFDCDAVKAQICKVKYSRQGSNVRSFWHVSIWGNDDFGMELDIAVGRQKAFEIYDSLVDFTTIKQLESLGFIRA